MKGLRKSLWWAAYIVGALLVQRQIPGVDALTPGFLISLQEKRFSQSFWLFVIFTLIQEGTGSLMFGGAFLWYGGQIFLFHMSARLFVADNLLFVAMLSTSLGVYRGVLTWFLCILQNIPVVYPQLVQDCLTQTLIIPVVWGLAYLARGKAARHHAH